MVALYALILAGFVLPRLATEAYDDSYFFKRVAINLLDHGALAWNVDEGPTYGLTSQTFQLISIVVAGLARDHYILATRIFLAICLLVALGGLVALTRQWDRGLCSLYALCSPVALYMVLSGMETAFLLALLVGYLWLVHAPAAQKAPFWVAPTLAVFLVLTRPDAAVLVIPTLLFERYQARRRLPWPEALVFASGVLIALVALRAFYGMSLPLPFYAKTSLFSPYDAHFLELSTQAKHVRFGLFLAVALPLFSLAVRERDGTNVTLLASVLVFETYLFATTVDVMGMQGRFYAPAIPLLCVAAARGVAIRRPRARPRATLFACAFYVAVLFVMAKAHWLPRQDDWWMETVDPWFAGATVLSGIALIISPSRRAAHEPTAIAVGLASLFASFGTASDAEGQTLDDDSYLARHASHVTTYRGIDALRRCVGERLHVYHSEVGVTGLRFQAGKVTDLAGLWSPRWLFRKEGSFDDFCNAERPEAIFLPHKNYQRLNREIMGGSCIRHYQRVVRQSSSPLFVREDLVGRYLECPEASEWR